MESLSHQDFVLMFKMEIPCPQQASLTSHLIGQNYIKTTILTILAKGK